MKSETRDRFPGAKLLEIVFEKRTPMFGETQNFNFFNPQLDDAQRQAVELALRAKDLAIIHGPPGMIQDLRFRL